MIYHYDNLLIRAKIIVFVGPPGNDEVGLPGRQGDRGEPGRPGKEIIRITNISKFANARLLMQDFLRHFKMNTIQKYSNIKLSRI